MGTRQILLAVLFGVHWIAFVVLMIRQRRPALLLPIAVFTLLVLTQLLWASEAVVGLGPFGSPRLPVLLRVSAIVLAVPSIGMMVRRMAVRRREKTNEAAA
jgi:hypothetical protein